MQLIVHRVTPNTEHWSPTLPVSAAGAYVQCWVDFKDAIGACLLAEHYLGEEGWIICEKISVNRVKKRSLKKRKDRKIWDEAKRFGYSLVFHLWPTSAPDSGTDNDVVSECPQHLNLHLKTRRKP